MGTVSTHSGRRILSCRRSTDSKYNTTLIPSLTLWAFSMFWTSLSLSIWAPIKNFQLHLFFPQCCKDNSIFGTVLAGILLQLLLHSMCGEIYLISHSYIL